MNKKAMYWLLAGIVIIILAVVYVSNTRSADQVATGIKSGGTGTGPGTNGATTGGGNTGASCAATFGIANNPFTPQNSAQIIKGQQNLKVAGSNLSAGPCAIRLTSITLRQVAPGATAAVITDFERAHMYAPGNTISPSQQSLPNNGTGYIQFTITNPDPAAFIIPATSGSLGGLPPVALDYWVSVSPNAVSGHKIQLRVISATGVVVSNPTQQVTATVTPGLGPLITIAPLGAQSIATLAPTNITNSSAVLHSTVYGSYFGGTGNMWFSYGPFTPGTQFFYGYNTPKILMTASTTSHTATVTGLMHNQLHGFRICADTSTSTYNNFICGAVMTFTTPL